MRILITGGAGFIGTNLALYLQKEKHTVTIFDNFSRKGTLLNAAHLSKLHPKIHIKHEDIRDYSAVKKHVSKNEVIFHLAGQVAVTTSIQNPRLDYETNVLGTFNVLEAARTNGHKPIIIDSSTNKVYGDLVGTIKRKGNRFINMDLTEGASELEPLDFYSPYGCSKGAADQYVHDYARIYDIPTVVFRQSCIYGPNQFGIEDQGWVAHFVINAILNKPLTIFGTGYQVRDILFIDDLIEAYIKAISNINTTKGEIFNIGGGPRHSLSLLELTDVLEQKLEKKIPITFAEKRPGDQDVYISSLTKIERMLGWKPKTSTENGLNNLISWVENNLPLIQSVL